MARQHEWISLSQAGIKLGHDRSYVSLWLRRHPNRMPEEYLMETGTVKLISLEGIEWIRKQTKKEGVLVRSEEHTSELQSHHDLVCRLLLEKKN